MSVRPPLEGIRVLDLSRVLAGPHCTMILADLGADVIKVEMPGSGDQSRAWARLGSAPSRPTSSVQIAANGRWPPTCATPTRSRPCGGIAARVDVVVENFLPGGADRLGLGFPALQAENPRLVYCSIGGYSPESPDTGRPGFDFAIQGGAGIMSLTGEADGDPMKVGVAVVDLTTGMMAAVAICAALVDARSTGVGRHVSTTLFDTQLSWLANRGSEVLNAGVVPERLGNAHPSIVPYDTFRAADGFLNIAVGTDGQFRSLCAVLDRSDLAEDERYARNAARVRHRAELVPIIQSAIGEQSVTHWVEVIGDAGVPVDRVRTLPEVVRDAPWAIVEHDHATAGTVRTFRSPIAVDGEYLTARSAPPTLGQHNEEILAEFHAKPSRP